MATKKIVEKKTGEKYASKAAMAKHEKGESKATQKKEIKKGSPMLKKGSPVLMSVSKKTAYDIKEASNQKLKPSARKHYAENAQASIKKSTPAKMKKC